MEQKDKIVIISSNRRYRNRWIDTLKNINPELDIEIYPEDTARKDTEFILVFQPPEGVFLNYPNLKVIASMAAGVNHILKDPQLPQNVIITKMNDPSHKKDMALFSLALVLNHIKSLGTYVQLKAQKKWQPQAYLDINNINIGIMGIGAIGQEIGNLLVKTGFPVTGWARTEKDITGIHTFHGKKQLYDFLHTAHILICVLPLTDETRGILNKELFQHLPENAYLINIGRGGHLVEEDLTEVIETGKLSGAALDVFLDEPLPPEHPFWENEKIMITPHVGGNTDLTTAAQKVLLNYKAMKEGRALEDIVNVTRGY